MGRRFVWMVLSILSTAALCSADAAGATVWELANDFSATNNPNGAWSYGYIDMIEGTPAGAFHLCTDPIATTSTAGWQGGDSIAGGSIWQNTGSVSISGVMPQGVAITCSAYTDLQEKTSTVRWTAPADGTISLLGSFDTGSYGEGYRGVFHNGTAIWRVSYSAGTFDFPSIAVAAGDTIDFVVWQGSMGDDVPITAKVTQVPAGSPGSLAWQFSTYGWVASSPAVGSDGTIYFGSTDGQLYAVDPDGSLRWTHATADAVLCSPTIGPDGTIYIGSNDKTLYALNPVDGSEEWRFDQANDIIVSAIAVASDGTIYFGANDGTLYALNPNGAKLWQATAGPGITSPVVGKAGMICVGSRDNTLYAFNPDGSGKWQFATGGSIFASPAIGADGTIYVGSADKNLYAINPDGSLSWTLALPDAVSCPSVIGPGGTIYVGCNDGHLCAVTAGGSVKWQFAAGEAIYGAAAVAEDGTIYVGSMDHNLYAIEPLYGVPMWQFAATDAIWHSSPAIGSDGTIYFGSTDGSLYAVSGGASLAISSDWPMYRRDLTHWGWSLAALANAWHGISKMLLASSDTWSVLCLPAFF